MTDNLNLGAIDLGTDDEFIARHIGPRAADTQAMLQRLGYDSLDALIGNVIPDSIKGSSVLDLPAGMGEAEALASLKAIAARNRALRSFIGQGYYNCHTPAPILRNLLENPAWYTAYTPYQPEISQGRLEALLNFQTLVSDLSGLPIANASMLDEATAAAEAMTFCKRLSKNRTSQAFFASRRATRRPSTCCAPVPSRWASRWWSATRAPSKTSPPTSARCCNTPPATARSSTIANWSAASMRSMRWSRWPPTCWR